MTKNKKPELNSTQAFCFILIITVMKALQLKILCSYAQYFQPKYF